MDQNIIVIESSRNLRALGRNALTGKWGLAVGGTVIFALLTTVPAIILSLIFGNEDVSSAVSSIYSLLISGPLTLGYAMFAISIFRNRETSVGEVLYGFERFGKALGLYLLMMVFILLWLFPVYIAVPFAIFMFGEEIFLNGNFFTYVLLFLFFIILFIPTYIAYYRYSMSYYILSDNPNIGPLEAIRQSKKMMKGNKWKLFCMHLSFIGWGILAVCTFGIGFLWLTPYIEVSTIAFYDIANGSLRSVRSIEGDAGGSGDDVNTSDDPITVYREESENNETEAIEPEIKELETIEPELNVSDNDVETKNEEKNEE